MEWKIAKESIKSLIYSNTGIKVPTGYLPIKLVRAKRNYYRVIKLLKGDRP